MSSSYQSFFSLISICSYIVNWTPRRQKKAGLYILCGWDSFVSLDTLKRHKSVLKICLTTQKSSQVTDILLRCGGAFNWKFLHHLVSVITESESQKFISLIWFLGLLASYSTTKEAHKAKKRRKWIENGSVFTFECFFSTQ